VQGQDKEGRPVLHVDWGKSEGSIWGWTGEDVAMIKVRAAVSLMEAAVASMGPGVHRVTVLIDTSGTRMDQIDINLVRFYISTFQANYPERLFCIIAYPSSMLTTMAWEGVKMLLDERPRNKVKLLSTLDELKEIISEDQLPVSLGGTQGQAATAS
jgi:hypothetical protein